MLNRSAVVLKPRQPFVDWINSLPGDDKGTLARLREEGTILLVPEFQDRKEGILYLKKICPDLFAHQLWAWYTDDTAWPKPRDWTVFQEWFDIEICSEVLDTVKGKLEREDFLA